MSANAILGTLAALGDPAAIRVVVDTLGAAVRHAQDRVTRSALKALGAFGPGGGRRTVVDPVADHRHRRAHTTCRRRRAVGRGR
ncbi:hypothetical protein [Streptomyces sp. NPDC096132]|uniref:hypothetical protein n=1 Tax=Streptomyces sp. NPDC096132 TaxID=3366075 RepID=UPI00380B11D1